MRVTRRAPLLSGTGTWRQPGLYCINPCGLTWSLVSVNNRVATLTAMKCADSAGSSLIVSGVVTFRVVDAARAVLDMSNVDAYTHQQAQAVLKRVASQYRYITYDGSPSLITEQAHLGESLRELLQESVAVAGVQVVSFALSDLSFAPEIAAQMLIRQQAQVRAPLHLQRGCTEGRCSSVLRTSAHSGHHRRTQNDRVWRRWNRMRRCG